MRLAATERLSFLARGSKMSCEPTSDPVCLLWLWPISWMLHVSIHNFVVFFFPVTMKILIMLTLLPLCTQSLRESASPALHRSKSEGEWTRVHKKRWSDVVVSLSPRLTAIRDDIVAHC